MLHLKGEIIERLDDKSKFKLQLDEKWWCLVMKFGVTSASRKSTVFLRLADAVLASFISSCNWLSCWECVFLCLSSSWRKDEDSVEELSISST